MSEPMEGWICPQCKTINSPYKDYCKCENWETPDDHTPDTPTTKEIIFYGGIALTIITILGGLIVFMDVRTPDEKIVYKDRVVEVLSPEREVSHIVQREVDTTRIWGDEERELKEQLGMDTFDNLPDKVMVGQVVYKDELDYFSDYLTREDREERDCERWPHLC